MIKTVYIISTLARKGPVIMLYNIIKNLNRADFAPVIITLSPEGGDSMLQAFKDIDVEVKSLNMGRAAGFINGGFALKRMVESIKPGIVHSHCFRSNLLSAAFLGKYKRVATAHCDFKSDFTMAWGRARGLLATQFMLLALKRIKNNICVSKPLCDILSARYKNLKFSYVDNGVDTDKFSPAADKRLLRQKLSLPLDKKIFIWAGVFIDLKSPLTLAQAVKQNKDDNLYFVFCGDGPLLGKCKEILADKNNVMFSGHTNNINDFFKAADFYIATSRSEGFHLTVAEAMSCGLPVILSDIPAHKYFLEGSEAGLLFKALDGQDLSAKINEIQKYDYPKLSDNAVKSVKSRFSAEIMSKNYQKKYKEF